MKTFSLSHVAMSVPPGTLTDAYRAEVSEFYGALFGWQEIEALRLPDRMTISVGNFAYINIRERDEPMHATGYEHFGVLMKSARDLDEVCARLASDYPEIEVKGEPKAGAGTVRFQHLLPLAVEMQFFPDAPGTHASP
jgi:hypothetical protein